LSRHLANALEDPIDVVQEAHAKDQAAHRRTTWPPVRDPLPPADERRTGAPFELLLVILTVSKPLVDRIPAVAGIWIRLEIFHALVHYFPVPVGNRNRLWSRRDSDP